MRERLTEAVRELAPMLAQWRQYLHAHPELSFEEYQTTEWLAEKPDPWSIP